MIEIIKDGEVIHMNTILDEIKLELFLEKMNLKTLEEIDKFFKS